MVCCLCGEASASLTPGDLDAVARACSPRVAPHGANAVLFDVEGLSRVCGPPHVIAREVMALATTEGLAVRVAIAGTMTAAWVLAHARAGSTVVPAGGEAAALAPLPVAWLGTVLELDQPREEPDEAQGPSASAFKRGRRGGRNFRMAPGPMESALDLKVQGSTEGQSRHAAEGKSRHATDRTAWGSTEYRDHFTTLARWGIRTCGELAALPRADLHARMGPSGVRLHQAACGEDIVPLTPVDDARRFVDRLELEWPIEGLEPLSFVLARQFERLSATLERADRGAIAITTHLTLVDKTLHTRELQLPAPMREARVLRTLVLLDLESHPPPAGIDVVELVLEVAPGHILQGSLLAHATPSQEDLSTLLARLGALMGASRLGAPIVLDTYDARQVALGPFRLGFRGSEVPAFRGSGAAGSAHPRTEPRNLCPFAFRRFRLPIAVRVAAEHGSPTRVIAGAAAVPAGRVVTCAGPWRTSGGWWHLDRTDWDRDEWDVELDSGVLCRLARHRTTGVWEIEGVFD
ncbi:MAG: hypothetical protein ABI634_03865 [Acidobacteriota bacterium]